jgi:hypothetical protein
MNKRKRIQALNRKASAIEALGRGEEKSVRPLDEGISGASLKMPVGCTSIYDTGWETNPRSNFPIGMCSPAARDYLGCAGDCWWPAQNPDGLTNFDDISSICSNISRDWRDIK